MNIRNPLRRLHPVRWLPMTKVARLRWHLARATRSYRWTMAKARKEGANQDARDGIQQGYGAEPDNPSQELEPPPTNRLIRHASRLDVETPPRPWKEQRDEYWVQGSMTGQWYLTTAGIN